MGEPNGPAGPGETRVDDKPVSECIHGVATVPESWAGLIIVDNVHNTEE